MFLYGMRYSIHEPKHPVLDRGRRKKEISACLLVIQSGGRKEIFSSRMAAARRDQGRRGKFPTPRRSGCRWHPALRFAGAALHNGLFRTFTILSQVVSFMRHLTFFFCEISRNYKLIICSLYFPQNLNKSIFYRYNYFFLCHHFFDDCIFRVEQWSSVHRIYKQCCFPLSYFHTLTLECFLYPSAFQ